MTHISLTRPVTVARGYSVTVLQNDGRTPIASCLPQRTRNAAITRAWTLANDIRQQPL